MRRKAKGLNFEGISYTVTSKRRGNEGISRLWMDSFLDVWKRLLLDLNTNISFLCGELLYKMCKGNTVRLTRHIGFESLAGYFYSKGILNEETIVGVGQPESLSSDEEYFHENPEEEAANNGSLIPETEEEEAELEYLMQKITEYNARSERK